MSRLNNRTPDEEFWHDLRLVNGDIDKALEVFYTFTGLNTVATQNEAVLAALNQRALLWNILVYSLQTTMFIVLGRIFDHKAHSIQRG